MTFEMEVGLAIIGEVHYLDGFSKSDKKTLSRQKANIMGRIEKVKQYSNDFPELEMIITPEHTFYYGEALPEKEFNEIVSGLAKHIEGRDLLLVLGSFIVDDGQCLYNRVPIITGKGKLDNSVRHSRTIHYDKIQIETFGEDKCGAREHKSFQAGRGNNTFTWATDKRKITYGIEVCADNDCGTLQKFIQKNNVIPPDVHLLVSNGINFDTCDRKNTCFRKGGYGLCIDRGNTDKEVQVIRHTDYGLLSVKTHEIHSGFYRCTLELGG